MGGSEIFGGFDAAEGHLSAEAFEKFKQRMKANSAFIAALQKGEQKQKKTTEESQLPPLPSEDVDRGSHRRKKEQIGDLGQIGDEIDRSCSFFAPTKRRV